MNKPGHTDRCTKYRYKEFFTEQPYRFKYIIHLMNFYIALQLHRKALSYEIYVFK